MELDIGLAEKKTTEGVYSGAGKRLHAGSIPSGLVQMN